MTEAIMESRPNYTVCQVDVKLEAGDSPELPEKKSLPYLNSSYLF